ncbi:hypothetical protein GCM10011489_05810 [Gordonia jinhuaensis]|uniref:Uncharacterized protein n=1 Tax=Gordonia jinhuaensis TaxID=1517702 RepID=A0A916SW68_9ACTN|nr:hypothetical protein GCM10011489_05810 [Gordonia jinhuaensis]
MAVLGEGAAQAAPNCSAANSQEHHLTDDGGCGAIADATSSARAMNLGDGGMAVAVAKTGGNANAINMQPNSSALAGADTRGYSFSVTTGPGGNSLARAHNGGVSVALAGWGGRSYAGDGGARCAGGFAGAFDSTSGQFCLGGGSLWLGDPTGGVKPVGQVTQPR